MTQDTKPILIKCGYKDAEVDKIINKTVTKKYPKSKEKKKMMTTRRSQMESKFMAVISRTQKRVHFFEVLEKGESLNSDSYVLFLTNLAQFLRNPFVDGKSKAFSW